MSASRSSTSISPPLGRSVVELAIVVVVRLATVEVVVDASRW
jgi:hypothetical protein